MPQTSSGATSEGLLGQEAGSTVISSLDAVALAQRAAALWDAKSYPELVQLGLENASLLLSAENRDYYTTIIIAHAAMHDRQYLQALPFYEAALRLHARADNLWHYQGCVQNSGQYDRSILLYDELETLFPALGEDLAELRTASRYRKAVYEGDRVYLHDAAEAYSWYAQALEWYKALPLHTDKQTSWLRTLGKQPTDADYTHWQLFRYQDAWKRYYYEEPVDFFFKLSLAQVHAGSKEIFSNPPHSSPSVSLSYAAVIIRHSDYAYTLADGRTICEEEYLDEAALNKVRFAWRLLEDAVLHYSDGRISLVTEWFDLTDSVVSGLSVGNYKNLFETIHFDPAGVLPLPQELYRHISMNYDGVVFVWPRGASPKHYGGGRVILPGTGGRKVLKYIGSIVDNPTINLHEFLHGFEQDQDTAFRVHGPPIGAIPDDFNGQTEMDWLVYLLKNRCVSRFL